MTETPDVVPSKHWKLKNRTLRFSGKPMVMGIVNVTPDSFSDGGQNEDPKTAVAHALKLVADGADILDIGGESTRPYSQPVSAQEELDRVAPVIESLAGQTDVPISVDTSKSSVAKVALAAGAEIINDVTGLEGDPGMVGLAVESGAGVCAMHMQGNPQTMQDNPVYDDVVEDILEYLKQRRDALLKAGIVAENICLDPGVGFGKTHEHNLQLAAHCDRYHELGCPILVGHSRKGFIGKLLGDKGLNRDIGTLAITLELARQHVQIVRVHEVFQTQQALQVWHAVQKKS